MNDLKDWTNEELCDRLVQIPKDSEERKAIDKEMATRFWRYAIRNIIPPEDVRLGK